MIFNKPWALVQHISITSFSESTLFLHDNYLMDWRHSHPTFRAAPPKPRTEKKHMECWEASGMYSYATVTSGLPWEVVHWGWPVSMASASLKPDCTHNLRCFTHEFRSFQMQMGQCFKMWDKKALCFTMLGSRDDRNFQVLLCGQENEACQSSSYYCL